MKTYLVCALNWGLGHATRCIPIIKSLLAKQQNVIIASDGNALKLLQEEFPNLPSEKLPAYNIYYPAVGSMFWSLLKQTPKLLKTIKLEQTEIEALALKNGVDVIISDNRYGCYSAYTYNIMVSHQINIPLPYLYKWFAPAVNKQSQYYFSKFDEIWIPDYPNRILTGEMSTTDGMKSAAVFVGPLSRLEKKSIDKQHYVLVILSGPEPQRGIFEQKILNQAKFANEQIVLVRGTKTDLQHNIPDNVKIIDFANSNEINQMLLEAKHIICRSGYSSIMDIIALQSTAFMVPTPGQTEQEILAKTLKEKKVILSSPQTQFNLSNAIHALENFIPSTFETLYQNEPPHLFLQKHIDRVSKI